MKTTKGHLTYCTNIHAGESWSDHFAALKQNFPFIKSNISPGAPMGIGLRLSNIASLQLCNKQELLTFKEWLEQNDAYVFTMNGFPYGGFHNTAVKDHVHSPDWTTSDRVNYTKRMFDILKEILPEDLDGGISTSPLSYRHWFKQPEELAEARNIATQNIISIAEHLIDIKKSTGKSLHLDIEPEPDGILETGEEFIEWFENDLLASGVQRIATRENVSETEAAKMIKELICLCYDVCHFAVGYEPHAQIIEQLISKEIRIGKFQISAALKADLPQDLKTRSEVVSSFANFNETTYLHQVVALKEDNSLYRYSDLPFALKDAQNPLVKEWRVHFHVPIFQLDFGLLLSTQADVLEILEIHKTKQITAHLEVETYTWEVLPKPLRLPIEQSIVRELKWVVDRLS